MCISLISFLKHIILLWLRYSTVGFGTVGYGTVSAHSAVTKCADVDVDYAAFLFTLGSYFPTKLQQGFELGLSYRRRVH